jgi:hypothetical protein
MCGSFADKEVRWDTKLVLADQGKGLSQTRSPVRLR